MDSWEEEDFEAPSATVPVSGVVPTSWEDEEEEEEEEKVQVKINKTNVSKDSLKPKDIKQQKLKEFEEKQKLEKILAAAKASQQENETLEERKDREQRAIEDADNENAIDAFITKKTTISTQDINVDGLEGWFQKLSVSTIAEHEKFGKIIGEKLSSSNPKIAVEALKHIILKASASLEANDLRDLTTVITALQNEKIQAAKPKAKKKKQTGRQGYANVKGGKGKSRGGNIVVAYDDFIDDDFIDDDDFM